MKNIVIIGGGIAGVEAACVLAETGNHVTIIERSDKLGGKLNDWYCLFPDFKKSEVVLDYMKNRLKKAEQSIEHAPMSIGSVTGIAGNTVVAKHLFHGNLARTSALVGDVLNEVGIACHGGLFFVIAQRYKND